MFIYILNLLNDGLRKKNNICKCQALEIIKDTKYISELADIKKSLDFKYNNEKLINVFEILNKYNLTAKDSMEILNKFITNNNNSWILEYFYNGNINDKKEEAVGATVNSIMNNSFGKDKKSGEANKNKLLKQIRENGFEITCEVEIEGNRC